MRGVIVIVAVVDRVYASLLPVGFHEMDLNGVNRLCVERFPASVSRPRLMETLTTIVGSINDSSIPARLWVDGSFLTEQENPKDLDVTMIVVASVFGSMTADQRAFFEWFHSTSLYEKHRCYNYALVLDGERDDWEILFRYWVRQYGFDDERRKKGVAEIVVPKLSR
jgi:hypothetical protein